MKKLLLSVLVALSAGAALAAEGPQGAPQPGFQGAGPQGGHRGGPQGGQHEPGANFAQHKEFAMKLIGERERILQSEKSCLSAATNHEAARQCHDAAQNERQNMKERFQGEARQMRDGRAGPGGQGQPGAQAMGEDGRRGPGMGGQGPGPRGMRGPGMEQGGPQGGPHGGPQSGQQGGPGPRPQPRQ